MISGLVNTFFLSPVNRAIAESMGLDEKTTFQTIITHSENRKTAGRAFYELLGTFKTVFGRGCEICTCEVYIYGGNCLLLKLYRKLRKMFLSPRWESNLQPSDLR